VASVASLVFGVSDTTFISSLTVKAAVGSQPAVALPLGAGGMDLVVNAAGTVQVNFAKPFLIPVGQTGFFGVLATISSAPGSSTSSAQTLTRVNATAGGLALAIAKLPAALGTVKLGSPTPTPTPGGACGVVSAPTVVNSSGSPGATVAAGGFSVANKCGQTIAISSMVVGVGDVGLISSVSVTGSVSSSAVASVPQSVAAISNAVNEAGTVRLTFSTPLSVPSGKTALFGLTAKISTSPGTSTSSKQSLTEVDATGGGKAVVVGPVPVQLGTITLQ
jgi:hypothetical protein